METSTGRPRTVKFAVFEVDLHAGELRKHGMRLKLARQPFQVLELLLEHPQEVVTREEFRKRLWPEHAFVDHDVALKKAINRVREVLGDSAGSPRFIETVPHRGYRFIGALDEIVLKRQLPAEAVPAAETRVEPPARKWKFAMSLGLAAGVVVAFAIKVGLNLAGTRDRILGRAARMPIQSLAVLPLTNLSGDPAQEYFADGLTDALIGDLSQISALKVISRTSVMRYKKTDKSLPQIATELGVDGVIEGTVQRSGDKVRITAQLIQGATDKHIWASSYERRVEDVLPLQGDIARTIAQEIRVEVTPQEKVRMTHSRPINLKAVEAYLQGQYHYQIAKDLSMSSRLGTEHVHEVELKEAAEFYQQSVAEDPNYARAYLGMAEIWGVPAMFPYPPLSMEQPAREALKKALMIDPGLAEAYVDLARIDYRAWKWSALEQDAKRAIELNPNLPTAHYSYAAYLLAVGRMDEAMVEAERVESLDPSSDAVAWVFYSQRRFDRFIEMKRSDIARHAFGNLSHFNLGYGYERAHMYKEAVEEWEEAMTGFGYEDLAEDLRRGYAANGFKGAIREWVAGWESISRQGGTVQPDLVAYLYGILGEKDRAFAWLEKSMEMPTSGPPAFKTDPTVDDLRSDPRFAELVRRVGLQP